MNKASIIFGDRDLGEDEKIIKCPTCGSLGTTKTEIPDILKNVFGGSGYLYSCNKCLSIFSESK